MTEEEQTELLRKIEKMIAVGDVRKTANVISCIAFSLYHDLENKDLKRDVAMGLTTYLLNQGACWFAEFILDDAKKLKTKDLTEIGRIFIARSFELEKAVSAQREQFLTLCAGLESEVKHEKA